MGTSQKFGPAFEEIINPSSQFLKNSAECLARSDSLRVFAKYDRQFFRDELLRKKPEPIGAMTGGIGRRN